MVIIIEDKESILWFKKSKQDFDTAKYNLKGKKTDAGLFFLQQSAEKALKAVYIEKFKSLIKVHDLVLLAKKVEAPEKIIGFCREITPAYQYTRYPDAEINLEIEQKANKFVDYVEEILEWAKKRI